jgi:hypothetical protein
VEVLLGQQKLRNGIWSVRGCSGGGLSSYQLVENIGTKFVKLNRAKAQELVASLVGLLFVIGIAGVKKSAQSYVVLAEDGLVKVTADTVTTAFATGVELRTVT